MASHPTTATPRETRFTETFDTQPDELNPSAMTTEGRRRKDSLRKMLSVSKPEAKQHSERRFVQLEEDISSPASILFTPVPIHGNPTEALAFRFTQWRHILKEYASYFKEISSSYEIRARASAKLVSSLLASAPSKGTPSRSTILLTDSTLQQFHEDMHMFSLAAKDTATNTARQLLMVRSDLSVKIREIRGLSGDFKNSIEKEQDTTRKAIKYYLDCVAQVTTEGRTLAVKYDPYLAKLAVQRQLTRQLEEENYLQRAYLNLEASGRDLDTIIATEIRKAIDTYANIITAEGEILSGFARRLSGSEVQKPSDIKWEEFVQEDPNLIPPLTPLRTLSSIEYPEHLHPSATEIRSGPLERKSKYLKSYSAGWFALTPAFLHEFKSSNRLEDLTPVMSLRLDEITLGSHSEPDAKSHKFVLKGQQSGALHRGHTWIFRAASHTVMMDWYRDIEGIINLTPETRDSYVIAHDHPETREGELMGENDEADEVPFSADDNLNLIRDTESHEPRRPEGGRFPSEINFDDFSAEQLLANSDVEQNARQNENPPLAKKTSSVWSYDEKHPATSTLQEEREEFIPVEADVPPEVERELTQRHASISTSTLSDDRRDSGAFVRKPPSRQATASYGIDPITGETDPAATGVDLEQMDWSQIAQDSSQSAARAPSSERKVPSRKPTASYGFDTKAIGDGTVEGIDTSTQESNYGTTLFFSQPTSVEQDEAHPNSGARPGQAQSSPSQVTLQHMDVPGTYPKE